VHAPAGYGKTAIAGTVSKILEEAVGLDFSPLGATFFFWRTSAERNSPARFIITITYQLAMSIPELAPHVDSAVKRNPMILKKALEVQLVKLIVEPFKALGDLTDIPNRLVIIDGLDECINSEQESRLEKKYAEDQEKVQVRILELIHTLQSHRLPLSFLILSRPEAWIKQHIESRAFEDVLEIVDLYQVGDHMEDVEKYVRAELSRIAKNIGDEEWPGEEIARRFLGGCNGHMLYASTVIRHIDDPYGDPRDLLKALHDSWFDSPPDLEHSTPFSSLYELYGQIMRSCPAKNRSLMLEVLEDIVAGNYFDPHVGLQRALAILDSLSGRAQGSGIRALRGLHAVLRLSDTGSRSIFTLEPFVHSSFPEFLANPQLSFELAIDRRKGQRRLLWKCLECMSTIYMQSKVDEEYLQFALRDFRALWVDTWQGNEDIRLCQAEYIEAVRKLLAIDLTACFFKVYSHFGTFADFLLVRYTPFIQFNFIDSFKDHHFDGELKSLVQQACFHVQSSMEGALILVIHQIQQGGISSLELRPLFHELYAHFRSIYSTKSNEWKSNCVVQVLIDLGRENEEVFRELMRQLKYSGRSDEIMPLLNYISQHEDQIRGSM
jgi:hypothetical protein